MEARWQTYIAIKPRERNESAQCHIYLAMSLYDFETHETAVNKIEMHRNGGYEWKLQKQNHPHKNSC